MTDTRTTLVFGIKLLADLPARHFNHPHVLSFGVVMAKKGFGEASKPLRSPLQGSSSFMKDRWNGQIVQSEHI